MKVDYKLLSALNAVMAYQSFERAAQAQCLTQSAISQRIKLLEEQLGHSVLIRSKPLKLTSLGAKLLVHYRQVEQLQADLFPEFVGNSAVEPLKLAIAVNADSLAVWFLDAIKRFTKTSTAVELDILVADESHTINKLKSGEALGAVCLQAEPINGYRAQKLGNMDYVLVASAEFCQRYFEHGINRDSLIQAPGVSFDPSDSMHHQFIQQHFGLMYGDYPCHFVRSSEAFVEMAKQGIGYCLIPELQITELLKDGKLINLLPETRLSEELYWHSWILSKGIYRQLSDTIVAHGQQILGG
ncbi:LysR family transcriptional regulator ArgP [Neptunicella sp. SCSIO 80796]|uniref:LysR family transcriptional regulator ArgP n=1 Tax=Neptunicella plasticusilytica TaxID=3117012 RepID=UPI003A4D6C6D